MFIQLHTILGIKPENMLTKIQKIAAFADNSRNSEDVCKEMFDGFVFPDPKTIKRINNSQDTPTSRKLDEWIASIAKNISSWFFYDSDFIIAHPPMRAITIALLVRCMYGEREQGYNLFDFTINRIYEFDVFVADAYRNKTPDSNKLEPVLNYLKLEQATELFSAIDEFKSAYESDLVFEIILAALLRAEWEAHGSGEPLLFMDFGELFPNKNDIKDNQKVRLLHYTEKITGRSCTQLLKYKDDHEFTKKTIKDAKKDSKNFKNFMTAAKYSYFLETVDDNQRGRLIQAYAVSIVLHYYHSRLSSRSKYLEYYNLYPKLVEYFKANLNFTEKIKVL